MLWHGKIKLKGYKEDTDMLYKKADKIKQLRDKKIDLDI